MAHSHTPRSLCRLSLATRHVLATLRPLWEFKPGAAWQTLRTLGWTWLLAQGLVSYVYIRPGSRKLRPTNAAAARKQLAREQQQQQQLEAVDADGGAAGNGSGEDDSTRQARRE